MYTWFVFGCTPPLGHNLRDFTNLASTCDMGGFKDVFCNDMPHCMNGFHPLTRQPTTEFGFSAWIIFSLPYRLPFPSARITPRANPAKLQLEPLRPLSEPSRMQMNSSDLHIHPPTAMQRLLATNNAPGKAKQVARECAQETRYQKKAQGHAHSDEAVEEGDSETLRRSGR